MSRRLTAVILTGLAALLIAARSHTYHEPLERDLTTYAVIAHELLQGRELYTDLWDHKPPGIHVTYAAAEALVGYGAASIFLLGVLAALVTLLGVYAAGSAGPWGREGGLWAAGFWALVSGDLGLEANQPNTEVFVNAALVWAFALHVRGEGGRLSWPRAVSIGGLGLAASLYKPHQLLAAGALAAAALAGGRGVDRPRRIAQTAAMAAVIAAGWGLAWLYFAVHGRASDLWEAVVDYNRAYAGNPVENLAASLRGPEWLGPAFPVLAPLVIVTVLGALHGAGRERGRWTMLAAFALSTHLVIALPGQFHPHYYQQWLPPLVVGAAWSVVEIGRRLASRPPWMSRGLGAAAVAALLWTELPAYGLSAVEWSREKYGDVFERSTALGADIDRWLAPGETLYLWGNETGLYFTGRRPPPTGLFYAYPFVEWLQNPRRARPGPSDPAGPGMVDVGKIGARFADVRPVDAAYAGLYARAPFLARMETRLLGDLERSRPELLVQDLASPPPPRHLRAWLHAHYRPFAEIGGFQLAARQGGALQARLGPIDAAAGP